MYTLQWNLHADDSSCRENRRLSFQRIEFLSVRTSKNTLFSFLLNFANLSVSFRDTAMNALFQETKN